MQPSCLLSPSTIASEQTYATCTTFLRMPGKMSAEDLDVAILGIPFDLATSNRPGARLGPVAIRVASSGLADLKAYPGGYDPLAYLACADLGDVHFDYGNPHKIVEQITAAARSVLDAGAFLIADGGDHFVSYPLLKAHARRFGPLALVHFDAHTDTWSSPNGINEPVELNHGTMFSRAVDEGLIVPERSVQIGIRTWVDDPLGITIVDNEAACETSPRSLATAIAAITRDHPVYITVDIDCLDPAYAPGTGTPVTGGLTPLRLLQILPQSAHAAHMWVRCRRGRAAVRCRWRHRSQRRNHHLRAIGSSRTGPGRGPKALRSLEPTLESSSHGSAAK